MPDKRKYVRSAELALGHTLPFGAVVHHVDRDRTNGRNDNLVILQNGAEHRALHRRLRVLKAGGKPWAEQICCTCKDIKPVEHFVPRKANWNGLSSLCRGCATLNTRKINNRRKGLPLNYKETPQERSARNSRMAIRRWSKRHAVALF